jgi:hypothetical protein
MSNTQVLVPQSQSQDSNTTSRLSVGAIAGIIVGSVILVTIIVAIIVVIVKNRQSQTSLNKAQSAIAAANLQEGGRKINTYISKLFKGLL